MKNHKDGDVNTTMRQMFKAPGVRPTKGLIDEGQGDGRSGHFPTKNKLDIGGNAATIETPMGTEIRLRK